MNGLTYLAHVAKVLTPLRWPILIIATVGACDAPETNWTGSIDTSATGVIVVRNPPVGVWQTRPWRLERIARIGAVEGREPFVFGRIVDVALGPDEFIYVLDLQAREVRVFGLDGQYLRTIGGPGSGPGEFTTPYAIAFDPDGQLWVADERASRYTIFTDGGDFVITRRRPFPFPLTSGMLHFSRDGALYEFGYVQGSLGAVRLSVASEIIPQDTIIVPLFDVPVFPRRQAGRERFGRTVPFAPRQVFDIGPDGNFWTGNGDVYRVAQVGSGGDTLRVVELDVQPATLSDDERTEIDEAATRATAEGFDADPAVIPSAHPYLTSIVVSDDGHLWGRRPVNESNTTGNGSTGAVYDVFTAGGQYLGSMPAPDGDFPKPHITAGYLVGVRRDSLDVQYVEVYRIVKPSG